MRETVLGQWVETSDETKRLFAKEALILEVTEAIWELMEKHGRSKAELAKALGTSKSNITQLLDGRRNMTLGTLSDLAFALGLCVKVRFCDKSEAAQWSHAEGVVTRGARATFEPIQEANENWFDLKAA